MINFVFEDIYKLENLVSCKDINSTGDRRFAISPAARTLLFTPYNNASYSFQYRPNQYIIATGVNHYPDEWTGSKLSNNYIRKASFTFLNDAYLADLRNGKAMLMFDQCLEGYQTDWLWRYFHDECTEYGIPPMAILYITGNIIANDQYQDWASDAGIATRINVIPYTHFEKSVQFMAGIKEIEIDFDNSLHYKKSRLSQIKTYVCMQRAERTHRNWIYYYLYKEHLLDHGLVSMNTFDPNCQKFADRILPVDQIEQMLALLPLTIYDTPNNIKNDNYYIDRIFEEVYYDTWVSVISEASFEDESHTLFISEKTFKSIVCYHPFIIAGNKGSLKKLRDMGYKTFSGFIDESYDDLDTFDRLEAIIKSIKKITEIVDKTAWFESMKDILIHNYNTLMKNTKSLNSAMIMIEKAHNEYFKQCQTLS